MRKKLDPPHDGKCINPNDLTHLSYLEGVGGWGAYITLWEHKSKDSVWTFFTFEMTEI